MSGAQDQKSVGLDHDALVALLQQTRQAHVDATGGLVRLWLASGPPPGESWFDPQGALALGLALVKAGIAAHRGVQNDHNWDVPLHHVDRPP